MIFSTRQDQHLDFTLGGTDFKYLGVILAEIGTSTKQANLHESELVLQLSAIIFI